MANAPKEPRQYVVRNVPIALPVLTPEELVLFQSTPCVYLSVPLTHLPEEYRSFLRELIARLKLLGIYVHSWNFDVQRWVPLPVSQGANICEEDIVQVCKSHHIAIIHFVPVGSDGRGSEGTFAAIINRSAGIYTVVDEHDHITGTKNPYCIGMETAPFWPKVPIFKFNDLEALADLIRDNTLAAFNSGHLRDASWPKITPVTGWHHLDVTVP